MRILITGSARAIGAATATELTRAGHEVVATARDVSLLDGLDVAMRLPLDVTDEASVRQALAAGRRARRRRQQRRHLRQGPPGELPDRTPPGDVRDQHLRRPPAAAAGPARLAGTGQRGGGQRELGAGPGGHARSRVRTRGPSTPSRPSPRPCTTSSATSASGWSIIQPGLHRPGDEGGGDGSPAATTTPSCGSSGRAPTPSSPGPAGRSGSRAGGGGHPPGHRGPGHAAAGPGRRRRGGGAGGPGPAGRRRPSRRPCARRSA